MDVLALILFLTILLLFVLSKKELFSNDQNIPAGSNQSQDKINVNKLKDSPANDRLKKVISQIVTPTAPYRGGTLTKSTISQPEISSIISEIIDLINDNSHQYQQSLSMASLPFNSPEAKIPNGIKSSENKTTKDIFKFVRYEEFTKQTSKNFIRYTINDLSIFNVSEFEEKIIDVVAQKQADSPLIITKMEIEPEFDIQSNVRGVPLLDPNYFLVQNSSSGSIVDFDIAEELKKKKDKSSGGGTNGFICFNGDVRADDKEECDRSGGLWDSPCQQDNQCPFYDATTKKNGCKSGYCQMPPDVIPIGFKHFKSPINKN